MQCPQDTLRVEANFDLEQGRRVIRKNRLYVIPEEASVTASPPHSSIAGIERCSILHPASQFQDVVELVTVLAVE